MRLLSTAVAVALVSVAVSSADTSIRWPVESVELNVQFDTSAHTVTGVATILFPDKGPKSVGFLLNKSFNVTSATMEGEPVEIAKTPDYEQEEVTEIYGTYGKWDRNKAEFWLGKIPKAALRKRKDCVLIVNFTGKLYAAPDNRQFSREKIAFEVDGTIGKEGIFLSSGSFWYPTVPDCPTPFKITARVPKGWNYVTNGTPTEPKVVGNYTEVSYNSEFPTTGLDLSAGPYVVKSVQQDGITISTYFLPAQNDLADGYLEACKKFLAMYSKMIGPYPFPKFAVVDNFMPSGYGMPGWTLLGSEVIRLPFIKETSLGHEVLHNWFGNGIFVDYRGGNWCEGLTSYLADYHYKEMADSAAAVEYRRNMLKEYADFVTPENDYPLTEFSNRADEKDRAIGYGKTMMIFHMMRKMLDQQDTSFFQATLKDAWKQYKGKPMSWENWRQLIERRVGQRLDWFFERWVQMPGVPSIAIVDGQVSHMNDSWAAELLIKTEPSEPKPYGYFMKFRCISDEGWIDYDLFINEPEQRFALAGPGYLEAIKADPAYDVFRVIYANEAPLTIGAFIGDKEGVLVIPSTGPHADAFKAAAEGLKSEGQTIVTDDKLTPELAKRSLWIFGSPDENSAWKSFPADANKLSWLPGKAPRWKEERPVPPAMVFKGEEKRGGKWTGTLIGVHPKSDGKSIVWTVCTPDADPVAGTRKLPHYGKQSYLLFDGDVNTVKGAWAAAGASPMIWTPPPEER